MESKDKLRVLQIDEGLSRSDILAQSIFETGNEVIARINVDSNIMKIVEKYEPDLLMIDMTSPNKQILEMLAYINDFMPRPIVFFADHSENDIINLVVKAGVSAFVVDGLSAQRIKPVIELAIIRFSQTQKIRNELKQTKENLVKTEETLVERKIVDKAKGILMKQRGMDEEMAYKTLRTLAMNQNKKMGMVAKELIDVAGLLIN